MHPEAEALLNAIWANPNDDTPRLVYADWLQENGYEDYAHFIRVCVVIARQGASLREHAKLRQERQLIRRRLESEYPLAIHVTRQSGRPLDGLPTRHFTVSAEQFLESWPRWWPFLSPISLQLRDAAGFEVEVARCQYLSRVESLCCEGVVESGSSHRREDLEWRPVEGLLLRELADNQELRRLTALKIEPIRVTAEELLVFADTPLAGRLNELDLWVECTNGTYASLRNAPGFVQLEIHSFVAEFVERLPIS
jgi:uncharacterized protein (TIGR02996 family)